MSLSRVLKVFGEGNEVALAVDFEQHADLAAGVDVGSHGAFVGGAGSLLLCRGHAALAQHNERAFNVTLSLLQGP